MYKKQMRLQKLVCLLCLVMATVTFVYALGISTDMYDSLRDTMPYGKDDPYDTYVDGSWVYYEMQDFNRSFVNYSIIVILLACLLFVMNNHSRRKYYVTNYISVALYSLGTLALSVWSMINIAAYRARYLQIDFEALKQFALENKTPYIDSTFWFDLGYVVGILSIAAVAALIVNTVWKVKLMRAEDALIKAGEEVAA